MKTSPPTRTQVFRQHSLFAAAHSLIAQGLRGLRKPRTARRLQLIETLPLGGKRQLMLISCDGRDFLLSACTDTVSTLVPPTFVALDAYSGPSAAAPRNSDLAEGGQIQ